MIIKFDDSNVSDLRPIVGDMYIDDLHESVCYGCTATCIVNNYLMVGNQVCMGS